MTKQEWRILELKKEKEKTLWYEVEKDTIFFFFFGEEKKTLIECEYNFFFLIVWSGPSINTYIFLWRYDLNISKNNKF